MNFYLCGLWTTGFILMMTPWDLFPICLPQLLLENTSKVTAPSICIVNSNIIRWFGTGTLMSMMPTLNATKRWIMAGALIIAGLFALGVIFIYLYNLGSCQKYFLPCRAKIFHIVLFVSVVQLLLAFGGLKKLLIDKHLPNSAMF